MKAHSIILAMALLCTCPLLYGNAASAENSGLDRSESTFQGKKISGTVSDSKGEPIIGATIHIKGTSIVAMSDIEGRFQFDNVLSTATINISYMGYVPQEVAVGDQTSFSIIMKESDIGIDEIVVVGFGTQKKINLTGAVGVADSKTFESRPVMSAAQALQGMVPGLNISQSNGSLESRASIQIRGTATIGDGSSGGPLILIDGMEGDINSINPQDIENISVLKDVASSSIYGSRAPFGVILITTKSGKSGKTIINYNNSFRWSDPVKTPQMMDSYTFATYFNDAHMNAGWGTYFDGDRLNRIKDFMDGKITESIIPNKGNEKYWADGYAEGNDNVDWYKVLYRDWVFSQEHNFSASGGTDKYTFYAAFNYLDQNGMMVFNQDTYDRYAATAKFTTKLTKWMKLGYNMRWTREDYARPSNLTNGLYQDLARQGWPMLPLYDPNGFLYSSPSPALGLATGGRDKSQNTNTTQQVSLTIEPIKDWITKADFNYMSRAQKRHWDSQQTYNHDVNGEPYLYNKNSNVHEDFYGENFMTINAYSEYSKSLNEAHNFKIMGGFQAEQMQTTGFGLQRSGIIIPGQPVIDLTSGLDADGKVVAPTVNGEEQKWATAGFFGRLNYDYKGRYLAEVNLRYDGTSRFRAEKRWNLFTSFSLGWNIAQESFMESISKEVNVLKIRASYGELGNQNTKTRGDIHGFYPTYRVIGVNAGAGDWLQNGIRPNVATVPGLISTTLFWERIQNTNIGLDFGLLNNRLTGSFDYYKRLTLDMLGPAPQMPATLGTEVPKTNNTDLETYGYELQIGWRDQLKNGLNYSARFMLSDAQTKITRYPNLTGNIDQFREGQMMGEIWGYETIGIAKTQEEMDAHLASLPNGGQNSIGTNWGAGDIMYRDLNGDGKFDRGAWTESNPGDAKIIGNNTPRYQFGLDLNADWKGFDVRIFFQGIMKRDYWQGSEYFWGAKDNMWWSTGFVEHMDYFRATASNDLPVNLDSYYPRPVFGTGKNLQTQTRYLQDASYIRLKNLQIGYSLPSSLINKINVTKVRVYVSGENLWTATKMAKMFDPETIGGGNGNGNAYPLSKVVSFGLSITL